MGPAAPHAPAAALVADEPVAVLVNRPYPDALPCRDVQLQELAREAGLEGFALLRVFVGVSPARALEDSPAFFSQ